MVLLAALAFAESPLDRPFALASYAAIREGDYAAGGIGGRSRWAFHRNLGLELYLEATVVEWPGGFRHDYPNGFSLYTPIRFGPVHLRPSIGFCDVLSFVEPTEPGAPRADDVMIGAHAGLGTEVGISKSWSVFLDGQVDAYAGHDRTTAGWTGNVDETLRPFVTAQVNVGLQFHLEKLN